MSICTRVAQLTLLTFALACGSRTPLRVGEPRDAGTQDSATRDTGVRDSGSRDAQPDAAPTDASCGLDLDGDGVSGCAGDCDDSNPNLHPSASEVCNMVDDDCDGRVDEGVLNECGDCRPGCTVVDVPGETGGWHTDGTTGLEETPGGAIVLSTTRTRSGFGFIANTLYSTITKLDLRTGAQVGEYDSVLVEPSNHARPPGEMCRTDRLGGNCPSRTALDLRGAVYVANRAFFAQGTVTKIAGELEDCVDRDGNGRIDTSHDLDGDGVIERDVPGEFVGQNDECVLWTVDVGGLGGLPRAVAVGADGTVWVGLHDERRVLQLSPDDGSTLRNITLRVTPPFHPYGAAIDGAGTMWMTEAATGRIVGVDTTTGRLGAPTTVPARSGCKGSYGIAVDGSDRVWLAGFQCAAAFRYDSRTDVWREFLLPDSGGTRGIAADDLGYIYVAASHTFIGITPLGGLAVGEPITRVTRFRADDGGDLHIFGTPDAPLPGAGSVGVGLDADRNVWLINQDSGSATRLDPATGVAREFPVGDVPYTYSDFTGFALRTFTAPNGTIREVVQGCASGPSEWERLDWDVTLPARTHVEVRVRVANRELDLPSAEWVGPFRALPVDLTAPPGPLPTGRYMEIEAMLVSDNEVSSPVLRGLSVQLNCPAG